MHTHLNTQEMLLALLALGLTQKQIATKTGIAQYQVSRWTTRKVPPSADYAVSIARLYAEMASKARRRARRLA